MLLVINSRERRLRPPFLLLLTLAVACASGAPTRPVVKIAQVSKVQTVRTAVLPLDPSEGHGVPVDFEIEVSNPLGYPITLKSVEVETVGTSGAYSMKRVRHAFSLVVHPGTAARLPIRAWVQPLQDTDSGDVSGPVTVRGIANFDSEAGALKTGFAGRVQ